MLNGRMSIAHVTEAFAGGVTRYMTLVLPALVARGHAVALYCCDGRDEPTFADAIETMSKAGVRINLLPMHRALHPWSDIRALIRLRREFKSGRYDMVHTHGTKAGLLGRLAARRAGIPAVHTPHCYAFLRAGTPLQRLLTRMAERALAGSTSGLIAVCESEQQAALRHGLVDPSRCAVISNGLPMVNGGPPDRVRLRQELGLAKSSFAITMAARLVEYKGIALFLDVADLCRDMDAVFILAGHGELEHWAREQVTRRGMAGYVRVAGHVKDVPALYAAADLCILCSKAEGQPYALLEAMHSGCPILAAAVPGIQDMLEHGKTAILAPRDAAKLASAIHELAVNETLRSSLAAQAKERLAASHLLDTQVNALVKAYECLRSAPEAVLASATGDAK